MGTLLGLSWPMMARAWAPHSNTYSDIVMEWLCGRTPTSDWETLGGQRRNNLPHNRGFTGAVLVCVCVCVYVFCALCSCSTIRVALCLNNVLSFDLA
jgi:hypothetical protein